MPRVILTFDQVVNHFKNMEPAAAEVNLEFLLRELRTAGIKVPGGAKRGPVPGSRRGKGGRPKGSKNKPKVAALAALAAPKSAVAQDKEVERAINKKKSKKKKKKKTLTPAAPAAPAISAAPAPAAPAAASVAPPVEG